MRCEILKDFKNIPTREDRLPGGPKYMEQNAAQIQKKMKVRIDKLLVERGLVASRERAQAMLLAGRVLVDGQKIEKAGANVSADVQIRLLGDDLKYVGRGGLK